MNVYREIFQEIREQYLEVEEIEERDRALILQIIDGYAGLTDESIGLMVQAEINQAFIEIRNQYSYETNINGLLPDTETTDMGRENNSAVSEDGLIGGDNNTAVSTMLPTMRTINGPTAVIHSESPLAATVHAPMSLSAANKTAASVESNQLLTANGKRKRKRVKKRVVNKPINLAWLKQELSPTSFDLFIHYVGGEDDLRKLVQDRFKVILSLENQSQAGDGGLFDFEGIPSDLRVYMRTYLGTSARRQAENYHGYMMAKKIHERVKTENLQASKKERKKRYKEIFGAIARAYVNEGEGRNDTLHCRKCKVLADKVGLFALVLYDVFSKNFITRCINDEGINKDNVQNIVNIVKNQLSNGLINARIENGVFTFAENKEDNSRAVDSDIDEYNTAVAESAIIEGSPMSM